VWLGDGRAAGKEGIGKRNGGLMAEVIEKESTA
jgi:hypothetical protein